MLSSGTVVSFYQLDHRNVLLGASSVPLHKSSPSDCLYTLIEVDETSTSHGICYEGNIQLLHVSTQRLLVVRRSASGCVLTLEPVSGVGQRKSHWKLLPRFPEMHKSGDSVQAGDDVVLYNVRAGVYLNLSLSLFNELQTALTSERGCVWRIGSRLPTDTANTLLSGSTLSLRASELNGAALTCDFNGAVFVQLSASAAARPGMSTLWTLQQKQTAPENLELWHSKIIVRHISERTLCVDPDHAVLQCKMDAEDVFELVPHKDTEGAVGAGDHAFVRHVRSGKWLFVAETAAACPMSGSDCTSCPLRYDVTLSTVKRTCWTLHACDAATVDTMHKTDLLQAVHHHDEMLVRLRNLHRVLTAASHVERDTLVQELIDLGVVAQLLELLHTLDSLSVCYRCLTIVSSNCYGLNVMMPLFGVILRHALERVAGASAVACVMITKLESCRTTASRYASAMLRLAAEGHSEGFSLLAALCGTRRQRDQQLQNEIFELLQHEHSVLAQVQVLQNDISVVLESALPGTNPFIVLEHSLGLVAAVAEAQPHIGRYFAQMFPREALSFVIQSSTAPKQLRAACFDAFVSLYVMHEPIAGPLLTFNVVDAQVNATHVFDATELFDWSVAFLRHCAELDVIAHRSAEFCQSLLRCNMQWPEEMLDRMLSAVLHCLLCEHAPQDPNVMNDAVHALLSCLELLLQHRQCLRLQCVIGRYKDSHALASSFMRACQILPATKWPQAERALMCVVTNARQQSHYAVRLLTIWQQHQRNLFSSLQAVRFLTSARAVEVVQHAAQFYERLHAMIVARDVGPETVRVLSSVAALVEHEGAVQKWRQDVTRNCNLHVLVLHILKHLPNVQLDVQSALIVFLKKFCVGNAANAIQLGDHLPLLIDKYRTMVEVANLLSECFAASRDVCAKLSPTSIAHLVDATVAHRLCAEVLRPLYVLVEANEWSWTGTTLHIAEGILRHRGTLIAPYFDHEAAGTMKLLQDRTIADRKETLGYVAAMISLLACSAKTTDPFTVNLCRSVMTVELVIRLLSSVEVRGSITLMSSLQAFLQAVYTARECPVQLCTRNIAPLLSSCHDDMALAIKCLLRAPSDLHEHEVVTDVPHVVMTVFEVWMPLLRGLATQALPDRISVPAAVIAKIRAIAEMAMQLKSISGKLFSTPLLNKLGSTIRLLRTLCGDVVASADDTVPSIKDAKAAPAPVDTDRDSAATIKFQADLQRIVPKLPTAELLSLRVVQLLDTAGPDALFTLCDIATHPATPSDVVCDALRLMTSYVCEPDSPNAVGRKANAFRTNLLSKLMATFARADLLIGHEILLFFNGLLCDAQVQARFIAYVYEQTAASQLFFVRLIRWMHTIVVQLRITAKRRPDALTAHSLQAPQAMLDTILMFVQLLCQGKRQQGQCLLREAVVEEHATSIVTALAAVLRGTTTIVFHCPALGERIFNALRDVCFGWERTDNQREMITGSAARSLNKILRQRPTNDNQWNIMLQALRFLLLLMDGLSGDAVAMARFCVDFQTNSLLVAFQYASRCSRLEIARMALVARQAANDLGVKNPADVSDVLGPATSRSSRLHTQLLDEIGTVEIVNSRDQLQRARYTIPMLCQYLQPNRRENILDHVFAEDSKTSLVIQAYDRVAEYVHAMERQQDDRRWLIYKRLWSWRPLWRWAPLCIGLLINVLVMIYWVQIPGPVFEIGSRNGAVEQAVAGLCVFLLCAVVLRFGMICVYEYDLAISSLARRLEQKWYYQQFPRLQRHALKIELATRPRVVYNAFQSLAVSLSLIASPLFASFILLDVLYVMSRLRHVLRAVTANLKALLVMGVFAVITLFLFAVYEFAFLGDVYRLMADQTQICTSLASCFLYNLYYGLSGRGGLQSAVRPPIVGADRSALRFVFEMLASFTFVMLLMNMWLSVIFTTYGDLMAHRKETERVRQHQCLVCGYQRFDFERIGPGAFARHVSNEHNIWHYVFFLVHISQADPTALTSVERYVLEKMQAQDFSFIPHQRATVLAQNERATV